MECENNLSIETYRKSKQLHFIVKITICCILLLGVITLLITLAFPYYIFFQFILGALYVHMKELQHETLHGATRFEYLNRFLGIILGLPMLVSYSDYKYNHLLHHKYVGTNQDSEYFIYNNQKTTSFYQLMLSLFMYEHYVNIFKKMYKMLIFNEHNIVSITVRKKIKQEYWLFITIILSIATLSVTNHSWIIFKLWVIPVIFFAAPVNFLIELPEHLFCNKNSTSIFHNTRTIKSNFFMSWFVNGNNYHVEHHYAPYYPISSLSKLHHEVKDKILFFDKSYTNFYKKLICGMLKTVQKK